jgi:hypothetical protein
MAFDVVKGLIAGGASLALQAVAPSALRAVKRLRARWLARRAGRERQSATAMALASAAAINNNGAWDFGPASISLAA